MSRAELEGDVVILACAISAGIHGALVPDHFADGMGVGVGFDAATLVLAFLATAITRYPTSILALTGAAAAFVGLIGSYALATTTGLPVLHPDPERLDGLALATKAIEAVGLLSASSLLRRRAPDAASLPPAKGTLT